jgi:hypothetical protein
MTIMLYRRFAVLAPVAMVFGGGFAVMHQGAGDFDVAFEELRNIAPRGDRAATVRDLVLRRDVAEFRLADGTLHLLTPVGGRTVGAVFVGDGAVSFAPPLSVEREHLQRRLGDSVLDKSISSAVFLFADSTLAELERRVTFGPAPPPGDATKRVKDALEFLTDEKAHYVHRSLMSPLLNRRLNGFFAAHVKPHKGDDLQFHVDPYDAEEIKLLRKAKVRELDIETVTQFQRLEDRGDGVSVVDEEPDPLAVDSYRIESTIAGNLDFSATATIRVTARRDTVAWARFYLFSELDVDSVTDLHGTPLEFSRGKGGSDLWMRFEPALAPGAMTRFRVVYHGALLERGSLLREFLKDALRDPRRRSQLPALMDRWVSIKSTGGWYPRYGGFQAADMDLTYHTPSRYKVASVGRMIESRVEEDVLTTRWVTELPTNQASFNLGEFDEFEITDPRIPAVTVQMNSEAHAQLDQVFLRQRDPEEQVGSDVANSLAFFTNAFGEPLFERYYATEIPYLHGQAFPGMIHLSWWTFQSVSQSGGNESFRAHEMAHQWWGIGVEPASYRDVWLSEGFSDFAGLWYMQIILGDNEKYFKELREWRDAIRKARDKAPPIWLGTRVAYVDPEYYSTIVYRKGAWVLHMLRNLMIDFNTMDESKFTGMMQDFYRSYRGRLATTEDFQRVVTRHFGLGMDWFFDQWVKGTAIPTYVLSWDAEPQADGAYLLRMRVRQENAPESFVMPVPLRIEFEGGGRATIRLNVQGASVEGELVVPQKPVRLELNPFESVLAEVKNERWRR